MTSGSGVMTAIVDYVDDVVGGVGWLTFSEGGREIYFNMAID